MHATWHKKTEMVWIKLRYETQVSCDWYKSESWDSDKFNAILYVYRIVMVLGGYSLPGNANLKETMGVMF